MITFFTEKILSPIIPIILLSASVFFIIYLKGFPFTKPLKISASLFSKENKSGSFKATFLALAGTLGVGNVIGVSEALNVGGAGAIFWMIATSLLVTVLKYSEIVLAVKTKVKDGDSFRGGAMYYLKGNFLQILFALLCILSSFAIGNLLQTHASGEAAHIALGINPLFVGAFLSLSAFIICVNGMKKTAEFCSGAVPFMSVIYIISCLTVISKSYYLLPSVLKTVFSEAFSFKSAGAGITSGLFMKALKEGAARGLVTNEAGCGTSPIAHSTSNEDCPCRQGFFGIFEVCADTLLCIMTSLVVLVSYSEASGLSDVERVFFAFEKYLGKGSGVLLSIEIILFALATLIGWSSYGEAALYRLTDKKIFRILYLVLCALFAFSGSVATPSFVWTLSDFSLGIMTVINTGALLKSSRMIKDETENYFKGSSNKKRDRL